MPKRTEWTDLDREFADWLGEALAHALDLHPDDGELVEHFVVGVQVGTRRDDGLPRRLWVLACCRGTPAPSNLMNAMMQTLAGRS